MKVALVLPCYNCFPEILGVVSDYLEFFPVEDVFVVDDGSSEGDFRALERKGVKVLRHDKNLGKGAALRTAFEAILKLDYTHVLTVDADGQHPARFYPEFLKLAKFYDIVVGSRLSRIKRMPLHRQMSNRITSSFISVMVGQRVEDSQSGFRLISRDVLRKVKLTRTKYDMESELLVKAIWLGFRVGFVPVDAISSQKSFINPIRDVGLALSLAFQLIASKA